MALPVTRKKLSTPESVYLVEVVRGLMVTLGHIVKNIQRNILTPDAGRPIEYPDLRKTMAARYRGAHRLMLRPDGKVKCVACMCCPTICPAKCITILAGEDPDDPAEKFPIEFQIDMLRCIYCGFCVEACPKDAIRMDTRIYEINAFTRQDMVHNKAYMINLMEGAKPEAEAVYQAHHEAAPAGYTFDEKPIL